MNNPNINLPDVDLQYLQNIFQNTLSKVKEFDSSVQSNIESKIKLGIDEISTVIADSIETTLTPAITDAVTDIIKPDGGILENVQNTYEYYKFNINLIFSLIFVLLVVCLLSMGTNLYANYMYITTPTRIDMPDEYDNAMQSIYDYSMTTEIKNMIYEMNNTFSSEGIRSAILDVIIVPENRTGRELSLFNSIIKKSQLQSSASVLSIDSLLKENNYKKIIIDIFIDHDDYDKLYEYLVNNSYDRLSINYRVENIDVKFKFKIYKNNNGSYYLVNNKDIQEIINYYDIYPLREIEMIGPDIRTVRVLNRCI